MVVSCIMHDDEAVVIAPIYLIVVQVLGPAHVLPRYRATTTTRYLAIAVITVSMQLGEFHTRVPKQLILNSITLLDSTHTINDMTEKLLVHSSPNQP